MTGGGGRGYLRSDRRVSHIVGEDVNAGNRESYKSRGAQNKNPRTSWL